MATIREQILEHVATALTAGNIGAPVYRSRTDPISRNQSPAVVVTPVSDQAIQTVVPKTDWTLALHVLVYVRGAAPDVTADPIIRVAHAVIMGDMTQGNLAMDTQPTYVNFQFSDADAELCVVTCEYKIQYRTSQNDLTIG